MIFVRVSFSSTVFYLFIFSAPSGPPRDVKVAAKSSTELNVSWEAPSKDLWNGNLLGYNIGYQEVSESVAQFSSNNTAMHNMKAVDIGPDFGGKTVISGLNMFTMYSIIVQAFNSRGVGPFSDPTTVRTDEGGNCLLYNSLQITYR